MKHFIVATLFTLPLVAASPSWAGTVVPLAPFSAIEVHGGGEVILHHGATQHVTLLKGSLDVVELKVDGDKLVVSPCKSFFSCPTHSDLSVDIVSPRIDRVAVHGGGDLTAKGEFPKQPSISVEAHGGGDIDVRAIPADKAEAEVHGGGDVHLGHVGALNAEAHGGGDITYMGNPQPLVSSVHGGGSVSRQ